MSFPEYIFSIWTWLHTTVEKFGVNNIYFLNTSVKKLNALHCLKSDSKDIYNVINISILNNCCFLTFCSSENPENMYQNFHKNIGAPQLFSTLIIIRNIYWAPSHFRMISEGSCDTEDWSNGCWKCSFAITGIHCKMYSNRKQLF